LTIGPAFLSGSIYLCLSRIIVAYGVNISRLSPRTYSIIFMTSDFISLVLQGAGGGIAATGNTKEAVNAGRNTMIAGLAFQVVSLVVFLALWLEFVIRLAKVDARQKDGKFASLRELKKFKLFLFGKLSLL
jgi:hypothetical protein